MGHHISLVAKPILAFAALLPIATAQTPAAPPAPPLAFDVVSIHPSKVDNVVKGDIEYHLSFYRTMDDGFSAENISILGLIADAYHVKPDAITGGPDWVRSESYTVSGKITATDNAAPPKLTAAQHRKLLQTLLADCFKLTTHPDTRESTVYILTVAPGGSQLHPTAPTDPSAGPKPFSGYPAWVAAGQVRGDSVTLASLSDFLSSQLKRPVTDKTGLPGKYDFTLQWTPDNTPADSPLAGGPSIFTALEEQLGIKLVSSKGPVTTLVIDHIDRPTEN